jgi:hypothetical protein
MNASKPQTPARQPDAINTSIEGNYHSSGRGEGTAAPKSRDQAGAERADETIATLAQKVGSSSIAEIEKLIGDLQVTRSYIQSEGERIQQEITRYAHLSDTASASVKIITESLGRWRNGNEAACSAGLSDRQADAA